MTLAKLTARILGHDRALRFAAQLIQTWHKHRTSIRRSLLGWDYEQLNTILDKLQDELVRLSFLSKKKNINL